jgi:hypothetical protein
MSWQDCSGVTGTVFDLSLGEILNVLQARSTEVRVREHGVVEIRVVKNGVAQVGSLEVSPVQARIGKISPRQVCSFEVGCR